MGIAEALIAILTNAPALINEVTLLYNVVKSSLHTDDQLAIDQMLEDIKASDAAATAKAAAALDAAAGR